MHPELARPISRVKPKAPALILAKPHARKPPAPEIPLRSFYVPAINERAIAKAAALPADIIILDLEDAVAPESKAEARRRARAALESRILAGRQVVVRVNGLPDGSSTEEWLADDLAELATSGADAILFPKIRGGEDVERAETAIDHHFAPESVRLWLMIETPQAILKPARNRGRTTKTP